MSCPSAVGEGTSTGAAYRMSRMPYWIVVLPLLAACSGAWNDPYPAADRESNTLYSAFL